MTSSFIPPAPLQTAVLFLVFNRPDTTAQVFEAIRQAKPPRLYVAADGPREEREGEAERVAKVREIATTVDWPCEVKTLFREKNLGCKYAVSGAITWFFEQEEQGIILEDDCLPHPDFFLYCESLLDRYSSDERVSAITGSNFQNGINRGSHSYYFSTYVNIWGWASWARAWRFYDLDMMFWLEWRRSQRWPLLFPDGVERRYWERIFDRMFSQRIDTWDYAWLASVLYHGGLTATPNVNLISNIGFGTDATHTTSESNFLSQNETSSMGHIAHPDSIVQDFLADRYLFDHAFNGKLYRFPWSLLHLPRRATGFVYRFVKGVLVQER